MKAKILSKKPKDAQIDNHLNCPNAGVRHGYKRKQQSSANYEGNQSQRRSQQSGQSQDTDIRPQSYAEAASGNSGLRQRYNVPTQNRFNHLNY